MNNEKFQIGFVGLGTMGSENVKHLLTAGHRLRVFDLDEARRAKAEDSGAESVGSASATLKGAEVVFTCLPSNEVFTDVMERDLLPFARAGQVFVSLDTVIPDVTRKIAAALRSKGSWLIDAPVTGGRDGAATASLRMFVGGEKAVVDRAMPLLGTLADPRKIVYCGESGAGQVVKGVNQLKMGLENAALLEAIAYGVLNGVDAETLEKAFSDGGVSPDFQVLVNRIQQVSRDDGCTVGVKFRELIYFVKQMQIVGRPLPLTRVLYEFCDRGERVVVDDHRPAPSFWHELTEVPLDE